MKSNKAAMPKVSVVCVTYNQEKFIAQTLDSFLAQTASFTIEIVVADDASSDSTPSIISEYAKKYPDRIVPILRKKNIGVLANFMATLQASHGEYIALCEGDDYWTVPDKLQKQADFLDSHPDHSICFHPVEVVFEDNSKPSYIYPIPTKKIHHDLVTLLSENYIQTNSVMYRRQDYSHEMNDILPVDWYLHLFHAQFGKIGFINEVMAVYRRHSEGLWWQSDKDVTEIWKKYGDRYIQFLRYAMLMYEKNYAYREIILNKHVSGVYEAMALIEPTSINGIAEKAISGAPDVTWDYIKLLLQREDTLRHQKLESEHRLNVEVDKLEKEIHRHINMINEITSSKAWRLVLFFRKLRNRVKLG